jgi:hypothetical protein
MRYLQREVLGVDYQAHEKYGKKRHQLLTKMKEDR